MPHSGQKRLRIKEKRVLMWKGYDSFIIIHYDSIRFITRPFIKYFISSVSKICLWFQKYFIWNMTNIFLIFLPHFLFDSVLPGTDLRFTKLMWNLMQPSSWRSSEIIFDFLWNIITIIITSSLKRVSSRLLCLFPTLNTIETRVDSHSELLSIEHISHRLSL